jgi:hypothetical protein
VLGLFNATTNELHAAAREGTVDAAFVIDTLDAWVATRTRPTVLVLDNARLHHAATFQARRQDWEDRACTFSTCRPTAPTSTKSRPSGAKSNTSGCGPKPTLISKPSKPLCGTFSTALACNSPSSLQPDITEINLNKHLVALLLQAASFHYFGVSLTGLFLAVFDLTYLANVVVRKVRVLRYGNTSILPVCGAAPFIIGTLGASILDGSSKNAAYC